MSPNMMKITPIKTRKVNPPKDDIFSLLDDSCPNLKEKDILLISSKILAIHQGRCIPIKDIENKEGLIKREADILITGEQHHAKHTTLTIKNNTLIPSAGIDESNANGYYILWPKNSEKEAKKICNYLKKKFSIKNLAVIITDSNVSPMRYGTIGISIGFYGLEPLKNYINKKDIFGRKLKMTQSNIVDSLSALGVLTMGEGNEQTPIAIISDAESVEFTNKETFKKISIPPKKDIYYPLIKNAKNPPNNARLQILFALFIALLIGMNLLGGKIVSILGISVSVGIFMVPLTFLITDIVEEVHGKNTVKHFIIGGIISLVIIFLFTSLFVHLEPHARYSLNEEYKSIFGSSLRMIIASIVAFALSQTHDAIAFEWLKKKTKGKALWLRNNISTILSQLIDTCAFMMIAFYHLTPKFTLAFIVSLAIPYYLFKITFAIIDTPFVYLGVNWLKQKNKQPNKNK